MDTSQDIRPTRRTDFDNLALLEGNARAAAESCCQIPPLATIPESPMCLRLSPSEESEMLPVPGTDSMQPNSSASVQPRPLIIGPSTGPDAPYPLQMEGKVIRGFGRGSSELGIPTANLPVDENQTPWIGDITSGVYFGWASLRLPSSQSHPNHPKTANPANTSTTRFSVYPMVMSIGYNKFYHNKDRSAEVHVLHDFGPAFKFYGVEMRLMITGFIREERDYNGVQALIDDIKLDCVVARNSLDRAAWALQQTGQGTLDGSWLVRETAQNGGIV